MEKKESTRRNRRAALRKNPRSSVRVECRRGTYGMGSNIATALLDVSESGARIVVKEELKLTGEVEVVFAAYGFTTNIRLPGKVIWSVRLEDGGFAVGVSFQKRLAFRDVMQLSRP